MERVVTVNAGLEAFVTRAAQELGIEVDIKSASYSSLEEDYLALTSICSGLIQTALYPTIHVKKYRGREVITPAKFNEELLREIQRVVNERTKLNKQDGVTTYRFNTNGDFLESVDAISTESIWSLEYSITSIFENSARSAHRLPLGRTELTSSNWMVMKFDAPKDLDMKRPFMHLFAHEPGYRINKASSHLGYVALADGIKQFEKLAHAVDYLEGVINE